jgi:hypothetical protein
MKREDLLERLFHLKNGIVKKLYIMAKKCMKCGGSTTPKMKKGGMPTKVLGPAKKPFAAGIPFFTGAGQTGPEYMKKGGTVKKMAKGGSSFGMLSVKAGVDKNPKPTAADRIAGAKMKKGGLVKKQLGGPATPNNPNPTKTLENAALFIGGGLATALAARKQNQPMTQKKKEKVLAKQQKQAMRKKK